MQNADAILQLVLIVASVVALVGGLVLIGEAKRRSTRISPQCAQCEYSLLGLDLEPPADAPPTSLTRCPECGLALSEGNIKRMRSPFDTAMLVGGIVLVAVSPVGCCLGQVAIRAM